jgi:hypothetical protein
MSAIQQLLFSKVPPPPPGVVALMDQTLGITASGTAVRSGYELNANGFANVSPNTTGGGSVLQQWVNPTTAANLFEVYAQVTSGSGVNGTVNAWLPMTVSHQWYIQANTTINQTAAAQIAVSIRRVGKTTPEVTAHIDLSVEGFN